MHWLTPSENYFQRIAFLLSIHWERQINKAILIVYYLQEKRFLVEARQKARKLGSNIPLKLWVKRNYLKCVLMVIITVQIFAIGIRI